ncbi:AI-2E family transporter [Suicoccus acidiformans]|uniref:AI-2E family transporter n=1 Tax=Suicoccus acidiformans TaxID=2036206 RepID=A0A347WK48_9LACT|nr:AI-2E family transporter [Suicoccus acidiformans]
MSNWKQLDRLIGKYLLIGAIAVIVIMNYKNILQLLEYIWIVAKPLVIGACIAYVLNILMNLFERYLYPNAESKLANATRRPVAILLALIVIVAVISFVLYLIIPQIISVIQEIIKVLPMIGQSIEYLIHESEKLWPFLDDYVNLDSLNVEAITRRILNFLNGLTSNVIGTTVSTVSSVLSFVINIFLSLIFALYILLGKERFGQQFRRLSQAYLPVKGHNLLMYVLQIFDQSFHSFITGEVIEAFILGAMVAIGMFIFRFPYAAMIGALTGVTALIPIVGAYLSGAVGFVLIAVQNPLQGLLFIVFIVVVQQIEGNLIYPRVVGDSIGLPGIWVLAAVTVGGGLWGIPGMLMGVPLSSAVYRLIRNDVALREEVKHQADEDRNHRFHEA